MGWLSIVLEPRAVWPFLLWKEDKGVHLHSYSLRHIDVHIEDDDAGKKWRFTAFYGNPDVSKHNESWSLFVCCDI